MSFFSFPLMERLILSHVYRLPPKVAIETTANASYRQPGPVGSTTRSHAPGVSRPSLPPRDFRRCANPL